MMGLLDGKRALVTGGSRGIGSAICRQLGAEGARVAINYHRNAEHAHAIADELNQRAPQSAIAIGADVSDEAAIQTMIADVVESFGGIDILVNNAGCESTVAALDLPISEWDRVMNTNLRGAFLCSQAAARQIVKQGSGGVIINNSSMHESVPRLGLAHYAISKAGLKMLTKALALEWAEYGIRVVEVSPGAIETEMNRDEIAAFGRDKFESWIPAGRLGTVDDVAWSVAFLASERAAYITGTTVEIDGGYLLNLVRYDPRKAT